MSSRLRAVLAVALSLGLSLSSGARAQTVPMNLTTTRGMPPDRPAKGPAPQAHPQPHEGDFVPLPDRVDRIVIEGLDYTKPYVVRRELHFKEGDTVTQAMLDLAEERLWNTPLFRAVGIRVIREKGKNVCYVLADDRFPISPLFEFELGGSAIWFHAGVSYRNFLGRYLEMDGLYEYFDGEHGGRVWFREPRLFGQRMDLKFEMQRLMRPRPDYTVRRAGGAIELGGLLANDTVRLSTRMGAYLDAFFPSVEQGHEGDGLHAAFEAPPGSPLPSDMRFYTLEPAVRIGRIDRDGVFRRGFTVETRFGGGLSEREGHEGWVWGTTEALGYYVPRKPFEISARVRGGIMTSGAPDQLNFWLGGLDVMRGYPDNYMRTRRYVFANVEAKVRVFETKLLAGLVGLFLDSALSEDPRNGSLRPAMSAGFSILFIIPKLVDSELRIDIGIPFEVPLKFGPNVGSAPFF